MKKIFPPAYLLIAIIIQTALHYSLPIACLIEHPNRLWGLLPTVGCFLTVIYLRYIFHRHDTTIKPFEKSNRLITNGVYKLSRNPIYLCMAVFLGGTALLFGTASPWIVIPLFPLLINRKFIRAEEAMLVETFGDEYLLYKHRVRRWI